MNTTNKILKGTQEALKMVQGTATAGRYNMFVCNYRLSYDIENDTLVVINLIANEVDSEDQRVINSFKELTVYEDRYSGDVQKLIITKFKKDKWYENKDLLIYVLIVNLYLEEKQSKTVVERLVNGDINWN